MLLLLLLLPLPLLELDFFFLLLPLPFLRFAFAPTMGDVVVKAGAWLKGRGVEPVVALKGLAVVVCAGVLASVAWMATLLGAWLTSLLAAAIGAAAWKLLLAPAVIPDMRRPPGSAWAARQPGTIRCVVVSDTHGKHAALRVPPGDVLLHCGDFTNAGRISEIQEFNRWLGACVHSAASFERYSACSIWVVVVVVVVSCERCMADGRCAHTGRACTCCVCSATLLTAGGWRLRRYQRLSLLHTLARLARIN